jgi:prepilin-type N-terminal cleavage/methylation domain-containing protein
VKKNNSYAFTLVELIVVIMILAILGTIGFLSFQNYAQGARNSARISDMRVINKAMSLLDTT